MNGNEADRVRRARRHARAVVLLQRILAARPLGVDALAEALVVSRTRLHAYLSGIEAMPFERQLCLARFVIENLPDFARQGHQLRAQVAAAIAFQDRATETHRQAPSTMRF